MVDTLYWFDSPDDVKHTLLLWFTGCWAQYIGVVYQKLLTTLFIGMDHQRMWTHFIGGVYQRILDKLCWCGSPEDVGHTLSVWFTRVCWAHLIGAVNQSMLDAHYTVWFTIGCMTHLRKVCPKCSGEPQQ